MCYQQDRIAAATYHLDRALGTGSLAETTPAGVVAMVRARIGATTGTPRAALDRLAAARRQLTVVAPLPALARSVVLAEAQLWLVCGEVRTAYRLLEEYSSDNPLPAWSAVIRARLLPHRGPVGRGRRRCWSRFWTRRSRRGCGRSRRTCSTPRRSPRWATGPGPGGHWTGP